MSSARAVVTVSVAVSVAAALALALGAPGPAGAAGDDDVRLVRDVAHELAARDGARSIDAASARVDAAAGADWVERAAAVEGLARALRVAGGARGAALPATLSAAAVDRHPNVRAAALRAAGLEPAWSAALARDGALVAAGVVDPWPAARTALAGVLGAAVETGDDVAGAARALARLAADDDGDVRDAALHGLVAALAHGAPPTAAAEFAAGLERLWADGERGAVHGLVDALEAAGLDASTLAAVDARIEGELGAVTRALALVAGRAPVGGVEALAAAWPRRFGDRARFEGLLWRAVAAAGDADPWLAVAVERGDSDLARAVAYGLGTAPLIDLAVAVEGADALPLLEALGETLLAWDAADAEALFAGGAPDAAVTDALAQAALAGDRGAAAALAGWLVALPSGVRERALRLLGPAAVAEYDARVFAAWELEGRPLDWLDRLPRDVAAPAFRLALLEFGADRGLRARVAGPLGAFAGDRVVVEVLTGWLDEELADVELSAGDPRAAEALASALARAGGDGAAAILAGALERAATAAPELAAAIARYLGGLAAGRELLAAGLERQRGAAGPWPAAVVDEALVALVAEGRDSETLGRLLARLADLPDDRQGRAFAALRRRGGDVPAAALAALAFDGSRRRTVRLRAVDALAAVGPSAVEPLFELFRAEREDELRAACVRGLGAIGGAAAVRALQELRAELGAERPGRGFAEPSVEEGRRFLDEELRIELARLDAPVVDADGGFLAALVAAAPTDLAARFERRTLAAVEFRWRVETATAASLARAGRLAAALEASGPWWRADGRALLALARGVDGAGPGRRSLARAALAALAGEGRAAETTADRALLLVLELDLAAEDWPAVARRAAQLRRARVAGTLSERAWTGALGGPHPAAGRDPLAWLTALEHQAAALAALERGDRSAARAAAARAAERVGDSRSAAARQAALAARLED